jgi:linoleoyl-CoA desaturase
MKNYSAAVSMKNHTTTSARQCPVELAKDAFPNNALAEKMKQRFGLDAAQVEAFGAEIAALADAVKQDLGTRDERYLRKILRTQKRCEVAGRGLLFAGVLPPAWLAGTALLGISKILENMEIGHNVMHGQWDWLQDPQLKGNHYEWDTTCPADQWRHSHNYMHHTFTNIVGKDRDVGYGILRMSEDQEWNAYYLFQPIWNFLLAVLFEWGVALHDLEVEKVVAGEKSWRDMWSQMKRIGRKSGRQVLKDYVLFPLLAGPFFLPVLTGNITANLIRNVWAYLIIFCGHFTDGVSMFTEEECKGETRGQWYLRQLLGSSNIEGGRLFHIMSGHLSHQIEHHLFPDMPSHRYAEVAPRVQEICSRYGLPYNTGRLSRQFGTVMKRVFRLSLPGGRFNPNRVSAAV